MVRRLTFKELCERNPLFKKIFTKVDSNWVKEDGPEMAMGNVFKTIPHNGAPFGKFADRADVGVHLKVDKPGIYYGKFGALVLRKNGVYKYKLYGENQRPNAFAAVQGLSEGEMLREVFRYKVTNGFLKKFSALRIKIFGTDDDVEINGLGVQGANHLVCEENLPDGSNPDDKLLTSPNSFEVTARDGFKFLKIAGVTVIDGNGAVPGIIGTPINTQYGQITITGLTKTAFDTYVIEYKFELTDSTPDHTTQDKDFVFESVSVELEDEDGSHASDTIDISVKDDVPTAALTLKPGAMLLVDETDGVAADMNETDAPGGDLGMSTLTAAQLFDDASTFGADGPAAMGSKKFELLLAMGDGSDSGLDDHGSMTSILLYAVDDYTIEGRVGGAMGPVSFRLEIDVDTGTTKLTQFRAVYHDDPMDHDEATSPAVLADDLIQVKLTVTDGDSVGDTDVAYVSLNGIIKFEDDGLMANDDDDFASVGECDTNAGVVIGNISDLLANDTFGSDEQGNPAIVVSPTGDMGGTVTIDMMGNITYTNTTAAADLDIGDSLYETFTYTIYDGDNDSSQATFSVTTSGTDIVIDTAPTDVSVDEDDLPKGVGDNADGDLLTPVPTGSIAYTLSAGATTATVVLAATPTFTKLDGTSITTVWDTMTNTLTGYGTSPMDVVFTIAVTNLTATGFDYELALSQAVKHLGTDLGFEDDLTFDVNVTITDDCNEEATTSFQALIDDDIPAPTPFPDFASITECDAKDGYDIDFGSLYNNDFGADMVGGAGIAGTGDMGGTLTRVNGGLFTYQNATAAADLDIGETLVETFQYYITDSEGDLVESTFTITVTGSDIVVDTAPTNVSVDEDDLPMIGNNDSANGDLAMPVPTGSIAYTLSAGATTATVVLDAAPDFTKLDGTAITTTWDAMTNTLTGYGTDPMDVVFTIAVTNLSATGFDYELSLEQAVKHLGSDPGYEDDLTFNVGVTITDDCMEEATTSFQAVIDDDIPVGGCAEETATAGSISTNLMLIIDNSGSMNDPSGIGMLNRLDAAKLAMVDLIDQYDALGDVMVRIISFNSSGQELGPVWTTADAAKTLINTTLGGPGGSTNFDDALAEAQSAFADAGKIVGGQNVSYFLSDGDPNPNSTGIDSGEEVAWESFLDANDIVSLALGMGTGISATDLNPIAYNGVTPAEDNAVIVTDLNQLSSTLVSTVSGQLAAGTIVADYGADGNGEMAALLTSGAPAGFTYELSGADLIVKQGTDAILKVTLDPASGNYVISQIGTVDPVMMNPIEFVFDVSIKDGDGDTATTQIKLDLDLETTATAGTIDVVIDEDDLPAGNMDNAAGDDAPQNVSGILPHDYGPDGAGSIKLTGGSGPAGYTFTPNMDGSILTANDGTKDVFTVTVNTTTGAYFVTLLTNLDHPSSGTEDNLDFTLNYEVRDADDVMPAIGTINLSVDDDLPIAINPYSTSLANSSYAMAMAALDTDGNIDDNVGADQPGTLTFANVVSGVTHATGEIDGQTVELTSDGDPIILYVSNNDTVVEGWTGNPMMGGTRIFSVTLNLDGDLNQSNDKYTVKIFEPIDTGAGVTFTNLNDGQPGNPPFAIIGESGTSLELLFTPINEDSINSDNDDVGVGGQFIDIANPDEGLRIDFGDFTFHGNGGGPSNNGFTINDHETVNGFKFTIDQVAQGSTAEIILAAYDAGEGGPNQSPINSSAPGGMHNFNNDPRVAITEVQIFNAMGNLIGTATGDTNFGFISVDFRTGGPLAGTVEIDNLLEGYSVLTKTANGYDRLEILNGGSGSRYSSDGKFSVSEFSVETVDQGSSVDMSFDLALQDSDSDAAALIGQIDITVNPDIMQA